MQLLYQKLFFLFFILTFSILVTAQKIPAFGKISLSELKQKNCSYDNDAAAEILINEGSTRFEWDNKSFFRMVTDRRVRIKIYNNAGLQYANVQLKALNDDRYEKLQNIVGRTYTLINDKIVISKLDKKTIYTTPITTQLVGYTFSMPNVQVGSIIEYKYTTTKESFSNIDNWDFQQELPVANSSFNLSIPEFFRFTSNTLTTMPVQKKQEERIQSITIATTSVRFSTTTFSYNMSNIPSLKKEPLMASLQDYKQRIEFQLSEVLMPNTSYTYTNTWEELSEELKASSLFGEQLKRKIPVTDLDNQLATLKDTLQKIQAVKKYFTTNFKWDGILDIYSINLKKTVVNKIGTSSDLNLLFINKLKEYGVECYPLLVSTKENGSTNANYPFLKQFNAVMAYIPTSNGFYVIDATNKFENKLLIPKEVVNTNALQITKDSCQWISLTSNTMQVKETISYTVQIAEEGSINGNCLITNMGYSNTTKQELLQKGIQAYTTTLQNNNTNLRIEDVSIKNESFDSANLEEHITFSTTLLKTGEYYTIPSNCFFPLYTNPFIADKRVTDIDFGALQHYIGNSRYSIPINTFAIEKTPKAIKLSMQDTGIVFERKVFIEEDVVMLNYSFKINKLHYTASEYLEVKAFYKAMFAYLNEPIVLRKK